MSGKKFSAINLKIQLISFYTTQDSHCLFVIIELQQYGLDCNTGRAGEVLGVLRGVDDTELLLEILGDEGNE